MRCNGDCKGKRISIENFDAVIGFDLSNKNEKCTLQHYISIARDVPDSFSDLELVLLKTFDDMGVCNDDTSKQG